jgi:hypothetical protein
MRPPSKTGLFVIRPLGRNGHAIPACPVAQIGQRMVNGGDEFSDRDTSMGV